MECGPRRQQRERTIGTHSQFGGKPCDGPLLEEQTCEVAPCPVDCEVSDWKDVGECDRRCGGGQMFQVREVLTAGGHGGDECPPVEQHVECNTHPCPVDCEMSDWQDMSACSLSCGSGKVQQSRSIQTQPQYGGFPCVTKVEREMPCNAQPCPVDAVWGQWTGWGGCSAWCGEGTTSRTRNQVVIVAHGSKEAEGVDREAQVCQVFLFCSCYSLSQSFLFLFPFPMMCCCCG